MFERTSLPLLGTKAKRLTQFSLLAVFSLTVSFSVSKFALAEASSLSSSSIEEISKVYTNEDLASLEQLALETDSPLYQLRGEKEAVSEHAAGGVAHHDDHATGHGEDHSDGHHKADIGSLFWPGLNFALYVLILVWAYKKAGKEKLVEGASAVREELAKAASLLGEAEEVHGKLKSDLANIEEGKRQLTEQLVSEGKKVAAATIEKAKASASSAGKEAERRVQSEFAKASANISTMLASRATTIARENLQGSVVAEDDARLRAQALELL